MLGTLFSRVEEVFFFTVLALMGESQVQVPTLLLARDVLPPVHCSTDIGICP